MAIRNIDYKDNRYSIAYEMKNPSKKRVILFLHGWGSNKELMMQAFGNLLPEFKHIYIDLPGFGKSPNQNFLKSEDYANIVKIFLNDMNLSADIAVGHSFGGKVATLLDAPCLVLLSSAGILVPKSLSIRFKIALYKSFRRFGLGKLRDILVSSDAKDMNDGMYETFKYAVNENFIDKFRAYKGKALLFWGESDTATPLWTGETISKLIKDSKIYPMSGDHYFFLTDKKNAKEIATKIENSCNSKE